MASWVTYTIGLKEDADPDDIHDTLADTVDEELLAKVGYDDPDHVLPDSFPEWDVLSGRIGSLGAVESIAEWLSVVASHITVVYFTTVQNTADGASVYVFEPTANNHLGEVEERKGSLSANMEMWDENERFPEYAMSLHPRSLADHRLTIDRETDHLRELDDEYGFRPLIRYA